MQILRATFALSFVCSLTLRADFSYQQKAEVTGGALAGMMKFAGAFSKQAREPMLTHMYVKGHKVAHVSQHTAEITDLDKETMTSINFDRKTYSVVTFEQLKQQFEKMSQQVQEKQEKNNVNMSMNVSAKNTGQTKEIDGLTARELVMTMAMQGTDAKSGQSGQMDIRSDMWMASVPGYEEVRDVYKLMGEKLGYVTGGSFLPMQRPDLVKNMGEMYKEVGKLEGMPVETIISMVGAGSPAATTSASDTTNAPATNSTSSSNSSSSSQTNSATNEAVAAAVGRLTGFGGFGGFGHKKKSSDNSSEQKPQQSDSSAANPSAPASLIEMTTRASDFSTASIDDSRFAVPDGFRQVENELSKH
jgi:hypothetical protein